MTTLSELRALPLPGDPRLTVADLAEEVAHEYGLRAADMTLAGQQTLARMHARHHLWGALRGAGLGYNEIAAIWNTDPSRVRNGVLLGSKRLGIEPPRGVTESGRNRRRRREHVGPSPRSAPS